MLVVLPEIRVYFLKNYDCCFVFLKNGAIKIMLVDTGADLGFSRG